MQEGFSKLCTQTGWLGTREQGWESGVLGASLGSFSYLFCDVRDPRPLWTCFLVCEIVGSVTHYTNTKDLPRTGTMPRVGDTKVWDGVPDSGELPVQGWEQRVKGTKRKEGQPPSAAGEAGGVRDILSGLDIKGQVELARARNWGKVFWQSPGSVTGKSKAVSETEALDGKEGRCWEWLRV